MSKVKYIFIALITLYLSLFLMIIPKIQAQQYQRQLVRPGISAGALYIGQNIDDVKASWGAPEKEVYNDGKIIVVYKQYGVSMGYDPSSRQITMIIIDNSAYIVETNNIILGTDFSEIKKIYPNGEISGSTYWVYDRGIAFDFSNRGAVAKITIFDMHFVTGKMK